MRWDFFFLTSDDSVQWLVTGFTGGNRGIRTRQSLCSKKSMITDKYIKTSCQTALIQPWFTVSCLPSIQLFIETSCALCSPNKDAAIAFPAQQLTHLSLCLTKSLRNNLPILGGDQGSTFGSAGPTVRGKLFFFVPEAGPWTLTSDSHKGPLQNTLGPRVSRSQSRNRWHPIPPLPPQL